MRCHHAGEMSSAASRGDYHLQTPRFGGRTKLRRQRGRSMSGNYPALVCDTKLRKRFIGMLHRVPVRLATRDHGDQRAVTVFLLLILIGLFRHRLFSLIERKAALAVERVKTLGFDEVVSGASDPVQQRDNLRVRHGTVAAFASKTTAPMVGTECFRVSFGPHFDPTVADHRQVQTLATQLTELAAEIVR